MPTVQITSLAILEPALEYHQSTAGLIAALTTLAYTWVKKTYDGQEIKVRALSWKEVHDKTLPWGETFEEYKQGSIYRMGVVSSLWMKTATSGLVARKATRSSHFREGQQAKRG